MSDNDQCRIRKYSVDTMGIGVEGDAVSWILASHASIRDQCVTLHAELEQVRKERDAWRDASGVESPDDLSKILDDKFSEMPEIAAIGEALSDLAEQGQDLDLAESWQARAESAERSNKILKKALERIEKDLSDPTPYNPEYLRGLAREALEGGKE